MEKGKREPKGAFHCLMNEGPLLQAERVGGNQLKAAELLGINRNTLRKRMRQLGISGKRRWRLRLIATGSYSAV